MKDIISAEGIKPFLIDSNISEHIKVFGSLESTNKTAKEMLESEIKHNAVIIADGQTAGRGRCGRKFHSPPGHGIYMSLLLPSSQLWLDSPALITAFAAVSVCEAIEAVSEKKLAIKWVNDIYLNDKKVCGILTEAVTDIENSRKWLIIGIGVNFNTPKSAFPDELKPIVGSVFSKNTLSVTRNRLIAEIINRIMTPVKKMGREELIYNYKNRLMMLKKSVFVKTFNETYKAIVIDIDDEGRLIIEKENGQLEALCAGEISIAVE